MNVHLVHQFVAGEMFQKVAGYLQPAIEYNRCSAWTLPSLMQQVAAGNVLLFVDDMKNPENALTAQFCEWGGERVFYIMFMGGKGRADWAVVFRQLREFAANLGVSRVCANMRPGWLKHLKAKPLITLYEIED